MHVVLTKTQIEANGLQITETYLNYTENVATFLEYYVNYNYNCLQKN